MPALNQKLSDLRIPKMSQKLKPLVLGQLQVCYSSSMNVTIVIPVFNQLHYTQQCLESLNACGYSDELIVVVNNASTDGTAEFLSTRPKLRVINNIENRACAAAWNQGFEIARTRWTVFLNNDVVVTRGWLESLITFAEANNAGIVSPAASEGSLDFQLATYGADFVSRMKNATRNGVAMGCAFLVAREVFEKIGLFDEKFRRGGNEDIDFFWRARDAGFKLAITGCSYIHHFGGITQKAVVAERGPHRDETVQYFRKKWHVTRAQRLWMRIRRKTTNAWWMLSERLRYGDSLSQ
jgi:GT2 family glycosyltransferase